QDSLVRLMRPLAVAVPATLVAAVFDPPAVIVAVLACACGFAMGALGPVANSQFVLRLPKEYRARAFGVVQAGVHLSPGVAVLAPGLLAQRFPVPGVVGVWGLAGVALMLTIVLLWPAGPVLSPATASSAEAPSSAPSPSVSLSPSASLEPSAPSASLEPSAP